MYCAEYASPKLKQVVFNNNSTDWTGGAMYCNESFPVIDSCTFSQNYTIIGSAVVFEYGCNGVLTNSIIDNNSGLLSCGGIDCYDSDLHLENSTISNNQGPGLYLYGSDPTLKSVSIHNNGIGLPWRGGGIYCDDNSQPVFDETARCNIYLNRAYQGNEIYSETLIEVIVDTFTVMNPTSFHAAPLENISFDILHAKVEQVDADLYVSPDGDNSNSGLTVNEPLKNIFAASTKLITGPESKHTIFLAEGTYSPSTTGEVFPVMIPDYTSLEGISESDVILDADSTGSVISVYYGIENEFSNITLTGAGSYRHGIICQSSNPIFQHLHIVGNYGEGIRLQNSDPHILDCSISGNSRGALICYESSPVLYNIQITNNTSIGLYLSRSDPILENIQITNNSSQNNGGGMFLFLSNPTLKNVLVGGNTALNGGGIYMQESDPIIQNVAISNNVATDKGGGIYMSQSSSPILTDVIINGNSANIGGGIHCDNSNPIIQNSTLVDNISASIYSGGIRCVGGSNINLTNSVLWNNSPVQIFIQGVYGQNNVAISYSDIQDGEDGIVISGTGILDWQEGNINEDPMFVMSGDHPYQINDYSPCIDAGTPDTTGLYIPELDLAGNPRFVNNRIDMGAYEWNMLVDVEEPVFDETETAKVSIYPNPVVSTATLSGQFTSSETVNICIFNTTGSCLKSWEFKNQKTDQQEFTLDLNELPPGIYFLRLQAGNEVATKKIVKL
jgi:parallel beta-helix repeat protein